MAVRFGDQVLSAYCGMICIEVNFIIYPN